MPFTRKILRPIYLSAPVCKANLCTLSFFFLEKMIEFLKIALISNKAELNSCKKLNSNLSFA